MAHQACKERLSRNGCTPLGCLAGKPWHMRWRGGVRQCPQRAGSPAEAPTEACSCSWAARFSCALMDSDLATCGTWATGMQRQGLPSAWFRCHPHT